MSAQEEGHDMAWFRRKPRDEIDTTPEVGTPRDQTVRDLIRFFDARGTSPADAIRFSAFFAGFAAANEASDRGIDNTDAEARCPIRSAHEAVDEGVAAVRAALGSELGRTLRAHRLV
jgi:hypothetical protein